MSNPYTALARRTLQMYLREGKKPSGDFAPVLTQTRAGVFVSLHLKANNALRGCIGTIAPTTASVAQEIIQNAISAATRDPRFAPVQFEELKNLTLSVDVLMPPEKTASLEDLNPQKYGVIVRTTDGRSGLLLPDLPGVDTALYQVNIAAQKGGIDLARDQVILERFEVKRYAEES